MADEHDTALRNSLDAVDRGRRWAMLGVGALFVATVLALGSIIYTAAQSRAPSQEFLGAFKVLFVAAIAEMLLMACCAAIVMFHVTRMTKAVLRRIDLSTRD
jgi:hypothetical protein